jgi:Transposase DDE domain group 1
MATACIPQVTFGFEPKEKPVVAAFDMPHASSDGGAVLLKSLDTQLQLTKRVAACVVDRRQPGKVHHQTLELVRQRVFGLACGYADCNDAARLADDVMHKLLVDRDPIAGPALASQPTLSRFENAVGWAPLRDMAHALADTVIEIQRRRLKGRATRITIDLDPTDDPTHGQQALTVFNGHYDTWCDLPIVATVTFNDETEPFAVAAVLRPGNAPATRGARGILRRLLGKLRDAFPQATVRVRLDGGFAHPKAVQVPRAAAGRVRRGDGQQPAPGEARAAPDGQSSDAVQGHRRDRASVWGDARRGPDVETQAPRHHQGRGRAPSGARSEEQPALRGDQPGRRSRGGLPLLLRARGRRKPAQGTASRAGDGPDQWRALSWPTSSESCSLWRRTSCSRNCGAGRRAPPAPMPRSRRCASGCSSWPCGWSARSVASSCTGRRASPGSRRGGGLPGPSAPRPDRVGPHALLSHQGRSVVVEVPSAVCVERVAPPPRRERGQWPPGRHVRPRELAPTTPWGARRTGNCTFMNFPG